MKKEFAKFETSKLSKSGINEVKGGAAACTCGTKSVCHIDGTTDGDCESEVTLGDGGMSRFE